MIKHSDIRDKLVSGLYEYMNLLVVQSSSIGEQPKYPFITYSVSSPYIQLGHTERYTETEQEDSVNRFVEHYEQSYSFTVASKDEDEAMDLCLKAIQYFKLYGVDYLKDNHIVVVNISNIQARDNMITINYERRYGFDVRIRLACEEIQANADTIEIVNFNNN